MEIEAKTITGWLEVRDYGESDDILFLSDDDEPLAERLEFMHRKTVTVRYWVTDQECTPRQASEDFLSTVMGRADVRYRAQYSEITGYLWTDEDLVIGGHDLLEELKSHEGKYLILQVEVN